MFHHLSPSPAPSASLTHYHNGQMSSPSLTSPSSRLRCLLCYLRCVALGTQHHTPPLLSSCLPRLYPMCCFRRHCSVTKQRLVGGTDTPCDTLRFGIEWASAPPILLTVAQVERLLVILVSLSLVRVRAQKNMCLSCDNDCITLLLLISSPQHHEITSGSRRWRPCHATHWRRVSVRVCSGADNFIPCVLCSLTITGCSLSPEVGSYF